MITQPFQKRAFDAVAGALPFALDESKVSVTDGVAYVKSPVKVHDYAVGVMAVYGLLIERIGVMRGLPAQTLRLNRRLSGLLLNSGQMQFMNGYSCFLDTWPVGPDNGTFRAKDGRYVTMIGLFPHLRDAILDYLECANSAGAIQHAVERRTAQELEDGMAARRLPAGIVRSLDEWLSLPQGEQTAARPMFDLEQVAGGGRRRLGPARHRPLEGLRVVELTHLVAGPTVGRMLAEQGAEVITVQAPTGDWVLPLWLDVNWGKKSVLLDLKGRLGKAKLAKLLAGADVLVDSYGPGSLERLGLDVATLQALNPNLIYTRVSYAAPGTPWADRKGFEQIGQAVSGVMHANSVGMADPTLVSVLLNDYVTGYLGAVATLAALSEREEKGGFWRAGSSLSRCATFAAGLVAPLEDEPYAPCTLQDLIDFGVDQDSPLGTFTRLGPAVEFSATPSAFDLPITIPGAYPDHTSWSEAAAPAVLPPLQQIPSRLARLGAIRNFVVGHGIEDRGDGGGILSLASRSLFELVTAARRAEASA